MRFPPSFLDEIRARLPVSEVVRRRVALKKAGREWKGLSPFNQEKTPSFTVNDQKGFYHCFSSGKHGDQFGFVMETEGLTFPEAVEKLAGIAGVPMPVISPDMEKKEARRRTLHDVMELAAKFFEESLQARTGARARGYLNDRGLTPEIQSRFRMGYAPAERFALKEYLGGKGVPVEDMIETGLLIHGEGIPVPYDRFRERVMFPIADFRNRIVGFGGRALSPDAQAKYLNSPETTLFHKGNLLYNGANARAATQKGHSLIVVEGYVDAISMAVAGFEATVAPLGTALTEDQLGLCWRMVDEPILCFDGDNAGKRAAYRAVELALPFLAPGKSLRFAALPEGKDPDDLIRTSGAEAMQEILNGARPLSEMLWLREIESARLDTPEQRAALEKRIGELLAQIADETVRRYYRDDFRSRLSRLFAPEQSRAMVPRRESREFRPRQPGRPYPPRVATTRSPNLANSPILRGHHAAVPSREALILLAVLSHPWLLSDHAEEFAELELAHGDASALRKAILEAAARGDISDPAALTGMLEAAGAAPIRTRMERAISHQSDWEIRPDSAPEDVLAWWHQIVSLHRRKRTLSRELREAERALGAEPTEANQARLLDLQERLAILDGTEALIEGFGAQSGRPARTM
ncbi:MAG: DNA primase [Xanthobacteraceae bacterium]|nr:DNA primase [Xanthobacteraceae bacterium]